MGYPVEAQSAIPYRYLPAIVCLSFHCPSPTALCQDGRKRLRPSRELSRGERTERTSGDRVLTVRSEASLLVREAQQLFKNAVEVGMDTNWHWFTHFVAGDYDNCC